jgi:hypothetical protein
MGNLLHRSISKQPKVFLFCCQDDNEDICYYYMPLNMITPEIQKYIDIFSVYGNNLQLQCFSVTGYNDADNNLIQYPEWKLNGVGLPYSTFDDYVNLKRLIKDHPESKFVQHHDVKKLNVGLSLTVRLMICFASPAMCRMIKQSLSWNYTYI